MTTPADLLTFWFGGADLRHDPAPELRRRWFQGGPAFDAEIVARFGALVAAPPSWPGPAGRLASILVADQLPRNAHRGTAAAFAHDTAALALAREALAAGDEAELGFCQRVFLYLPLEHAEDLAAQDESVARFEALAGAASEADAELARLCVDFAHQHREQIRRFGRFPGRNRALGRPDRPEEAAWRAAGGPTFGQG